MGGHEPDIQGRCEPELRALADCFVENFASRGEVGAAVALVQDGELVVDLWGGSRDSDGSHAWTGDTVVNVWSTTKGVVAVCFAMLIDRGQLRYDDRVADHWPEFGAGGKGEVSVAILLSHQAGVCGFRTPAVLQDFYDLRTAGARLAAQAPFWVPGTRSGYHALTLGILASELFRRVEGRTLGEFVRAELSEPFGLDFSIGLPPAADARAATILAPPDFGSAAMNPDLNEAQAATLGNPVLSPLDANTTAWRAAELPSANGFGNARGLARLYGALADDGRLDGRPLLGADALGEATAERIAGIDEVMAISVRWAAGFLLNTDGIYGSSPRAFGHSGWGGSFAFADPDRRCALAYTMNRMGTDLVGDPRNIALIEALEGTATSRS